MMTSDYTQTLKTIKEAEEASEKAIADKRKMLADQLQMAQDRAAKDISDARAAAEAYIAQEIEKARAAAEADAKKLVDAAAIQAKSVAQKKVDDAEFRKIIQEILLSEFTGE